MDDSAPLEPASPEPEPSEPLPPAAAKRASTPSRGKLLAKLEKNRGRPWRAAVVVVALAALLGGLVWLQSTGPSWIDYADADGRFTVQFPDTPKLTTLVVPTWTGNKAPIRSAMYGTRWEDEFYAVEACTYDQSVPKDRVEPLLESIGDDYVKRIEGLGAGRDVRLTASRQWAFAGHPGRELEMSVRGGAGILVARILLVDERHLIMLRTGAHEHHHGENDRRFLESFKLVRH
jgi:hypothetical protein